MVIAWPAACKPPPDRVRDVSSRSSLRYIAPMNTLSIARFVTTLLPAAFFAALPAAVVAGRQDDATARVAAKDAAETLHELYRERFAWRMEAFPEEAMHRGDYTNAHRITDESLAAIELRHGVTRNHLAALRLIDRAALDEDDLVNYELLDLALSNAIEDNAYRMFLAPIGARFGPHQDIPQMADGMRFATAKDYDNYFDRLRLAPQSVDQVIERMRRGLAEGITPPRVTLAGVPAQIDALLAEGGLDALSAPLDAIPASVPAGAQEALRGRWRFETEPPIREALTRLRTFVVDDYIPHTRTDIAASTLPQGPALYAHQLWKMTTTRMTPEEIHRLGVDEVARIRVEMMEVIRRSDFLEHHSALAEEDDASLFRSFVAYLRSDPRFYHEDPEALLTGYRDICKRVDAWLPKFFGRLPRLPYGVKKIPDFMAPQQTTAYYNFGSIENGEPGYFYANTYALDQRPKYEMIALAMHEAVPGHHLQSAIAQELEDVPELRTTMWFNAFGEGWALYSERLGLEMELYEDPYDDFGRLLYEMWRACRLVVDPGIHALGWTRQEAIDYMLDNTALSELNITNEVDRYIAWPGQACGYKIGELKIRELRAFAEQRLGRSFDIRAFHDVVLGAGSIPLTVLERRVHDWVRSKPGGVVYD